MFIATNREELNALQGICITEPRDAVAVAMRAAKDDDEEWRIGLFLDARRRVIRTEVIRLGQTCREHLDPLQFIEIALEEEASLITVRYHHHDARLVTEHGPARNLAWIQTCEAARPGLFFDHISLDHSGRFFSVRGQY